MNKRNNLIFTVILFSIVLCSIVSFGRDCYDFKNTTDSLSEKVAFDNKLHNALFDSHDSSYPWYIIPDDDGTFETALDREITEEDKTPIEHTSNCVSTHQGHHKMVFCDAVSETDGSLKLFIYGGMPAYSSSLMVLIKDSKFWCYFKTAYPAPVYDCTWKILSKKLTLKNHEIKKGKRLFAWLSVIFEETSTYNHVTSTNSYKIEGFVKPVVK